MSLLVLGGTAWLGREVVAAARALGQDVTVLARGVSGAPPDGVEVVRADRGDATAYDEVAGREWDVVVDVSRQPSHVAGALDALASRAASWVFVSSASVYATHDVAGADETAELLPAHPGDDDGWETYGGRKVACERSVLDHVGDRALVARSGLIAGPGDHTDRTGYWPLRFAHPASPDGAVLVPDRGASTQVLDVRDLAAWLVRAGLERAAGVVNASGPVMPLDDHLAVARDVAGHRGETVRVGQEWLADHEVQPWSGDRSLPLWLSVPEYAGFMARSTAAAQALGLTSRSLAETLADTLAWEVASGPGRVRKAGLTVTDELALLASARSGPHPG
ncbi:nucleoside-diphosphate-sugar epimerase [Phycicoccus badiiscoriae]|uniref:Nucleoside-diphosphate-sugar epimerase n=1 Tax=Pedococcus badiiscoriae TaxID=642776 RepID=A0A852WQK9_9MICO|nr:NAD-dependent epimerase/dehydratase family protein [Pedococcus badiiscoriae]NYG08495.1 nucleoside-diphosphate-sugar epimerase [Pedococcus badiiscoriae]